MDFSESQLRAFERQLADHGRESLERSKANLETRVVEHLQKLWQYRAVGGHTSSIEREIENFREQIRAIDELLGRTL